MFRAYSPLPISDLFLSTSFSQLFGLIFNNLRNLLNGSRLQRCSDSSAGRQSQLASIVTGDHIGCRSYAASIVPGRGSKVSRDVRDLFQRSEDSVLEIMTPPRNGVHICAGLRVSFEGLDTTLSFVPISAIPRISSDNMNIGLITLRTSKTIYNHTLVSVCAILF
jgi:hypothetical protein